MLTEKEYNNTILYLELGPGDSGKKLEIIYEVERLEKGSYKAQMPIDKKYLEANLLMPVGGRFTEIARKRLKERVKMVSWFRPGRYTTTLSTTCAI